MKKGLAYVAILAVFGVAMVGCTAFTKNHSTDPYGATSAPAPQLFAGAEGAFNEFMEGFPSQISTIFTQGATGSDRQFLGYWNYTTTAQDYSNDWSTAYSNVLYNLRLAEEEAAANGQTNVEGAAKVLEGIQMGTITALWGAVPYSQAAEPSVTTTPKYDSQDSVYTEVQATLSAGISELQANNVALPSDIFSSAGDPAEWIAAGYTAKARYMMQQARGDGYTQADLNNVINWAKQGIINTDGSQDMMFTHSTGTYNGDMNLWYSFGVYDRSGYINASKSFLIPMLEAYGMGSQMNYYFDTTASPIDLNYAAAFSATSPFPIFRASEANLLIAEAYCRLDNLTDALTYLNNAIAYNDNTYGDATAAYAATDPAVSSQAAMLQTIFNEEYMALFPEIEVFNFARRVDYQIIYTSGGNTVQLKPTNGNPATQLNFPQRLLYPTAEITANPNTPKQGTGALFTPTTVNTPKDNMLSQ